jgi:hypothetical protein
MSKRGRFLVGFHMQRPAPGVKTETKNPEMIVHEEVEYAVRLKKKHYEATYIFDIDKMDFELNKVDNFTVELCLTHLQKHFPNQYPIWFNKDEEKTNKEKE